MVFVTMVFLAAATSTRWLHGAPSATAPGAGAGRILAWALLVGLILQLIIGAMYRHLTSDLVSGDMETNHILMAHIALAAVVMLLAIINGIRASSTTVGGDVQKRIGLILILLVILQVTLGLLATILVMGRDPGEPIPVVEVIITSAHQANGGLLLAAAVLLTAWQSRLERT